jgi:hypothetical protein
MTFVDRWSWRLRALIVCGLIGFGSAAIAQDRAPAAVSGDSLLVATAQHAVAVTVSYVSGAPTSVDGADTLLSGASARDTGAYWIVTVTRVGFTILDRPRIIAVEKVTGKARDVFIHDPHKGHDDDAPRSQDHSDEGS